MNDSSLAEASKLFGGAYRLQAELAREPLGRRFWGTDRSGREVQLQLLEAEGEWGSRAETLGQRLHAASHPDTVRYDVWGHLPVPHLIRRRLRGENVSTWVNRRRGAIPPSEALRVVADLVAQLLSLHEQGVFLGVLATSHLVLNESGGLQLLDPTLLAWRWSESRKLSDEEPWERELLVPPELEANGLEAVSVASDVWCVGALLFVLLSGFQEPVGHRDGRQLLAPSRILGRMNDDCPARVRAVVDRCLATDPKSRPESLSRVRTTLEQLARHPQLRQMRRFSTLPPLGVSPPGVQRSGLTPNGVSLSNSALRIPPLPVSLTGGEAVRHPSAPEWTERQTAPAMRRAGSSAPPPPAVALEDLEPYLTSADDAEPQLRKHLARQLLLDLEHGAPMRWYVEPWGFACQSGVWEATDSLRLLPHRLYESGLRGFVLIPGLELHEAKRFFQLLRWGLRSELSAADVLLALGNQLSDQIALETIGAYELGNESLDAQRQMVDDLHRLLQFDGLFSLEERRHQDAVQRDPLNVQRESWPTPAPSAPEGDGSDGWPSVIEAALLHWTPAVRQTLDAAMRLALETLLARTPQSTMESVLGAVASTERLATLMPPPSLASFAERVPVTSDTLSLWAELAHQLGRPTATADALQGLREQLRNLVHLPAADWPSSWADLGSRLRARSGTSPTRSTSNVATSREDAP